LRIIKPEIITLNTKEPKKYNGHFKVVFEALKQLMEPPPVPEKPPIGFHPHR